MTKNELVERIKDKNALFNRQEVDHFITTFIVVLKDAAIAGDDVPLPGFGRFTSLDVPIKSGRNPRTGDPIVIAAHKAFKFKLSPSMKERLKKMKLLIIILALVSFNAMADGGDRQDVNYWSGLNNYHGRYTDTAPHAHKRKNLDDQYCWWKKVGGTWVDTCEVNKSSHGEYMHNHKPVPVSVPEPEIIGLLGVACLFFAIKKRKKA